MGEPVSQSTNAVGTYATRGFRAPRRSVALKWSTNVPISSGVESPELVNTALLLFFERVLTSASPLLTLHEGGVFATTVRDAREKRWDVSVLVFNPRRHAHDDRLGDHDQIRAIAKVRIAGLYGLRGEGDWESVEGGYFSFVFCTSVASVRCRRSPSSWLPRVADILVT